jgi:multidrug efflux system outer membrane protein
LLWRATGARLTCKEIDMKTRILAACITGALAGCTVGPNYRSPTVETPPAWRIDYPKAADVANLKWWEQFGDPVLNQLVETALRENRDLRVAAARVDQFIGVLTATGAQLYPQIGYGADASRVRASAVGQPPLPPGANPYFSLYNVSLGASWQTDLFGRVRRQTEAAQAQVYASEQGQRGVVLTLVSDVAASYIVLRSLDRQLEIAQATARNYEGTLRIFELRFAKGLIAKTELSQIRSQTQQARAAVPQFHQAIATQENLLSILLGASPGPIPRGKTIDQLIAPTIPGDLPTTLLQRRPDIVAAEQNLVAANANIGAARALYYPNISLQAALATTATATGALFSGPAAAGLIGAGLAGPIFTFGAIEGQVASAEAGERAALAAYQQTILNALRETNDALSGTQRRARGVQPAARARGGAARVRTAVQAALRQGCVGLSGGAGGRERTLRRRTGIGQPAGQQLRADRRRLPGDGWWLGGHRRRHGAQATGHGRRAGQAVNPRRCGA